MCCTIYDSTCHLCHCILFYYLQLDALQPEGFWINSYLQDSEAMLPLLLPLVFLWLGFNIITLVYDICLGVMLWVSVKRLETLCFVRRYTNKTKLDWIVLLGSSISIILPPIYSLSLLCMYPNQFSLASLIFFSTSTYGCSSDVLIHLCHSHRNITLKRKAGRSCLLF